MSDTQMSTQQSFSTENDQVDGYRQLSRLAVWSIPLGLLSALSLISPLLWCVPMVAVTFALGGLWQISRSNNTTGRRLALTGLGLAILFGTWGMTWSISRRMVINHQAREHASEWLALMQKGDYMKAHQLGMEYYERLPSGSSLEEHYEERESPANDEARPSPEMAPSSFTALKNFMEEDIPQMLVDANGDFEFVFVRNMTLQRDDQFATTVDQVFRLRFSDDHEPREMDIKIELKRTVDMHKAYWQIGPTSNASKSS
ncbi:MAG TPA: hypothetical protein QF564_16015 [Pirellulaceae bacterium]|jgi:hypothetical protein|nr:hypothetical protein [Pirellulaceae bacterium]